MNTTKNEVLVSVIIPTYNRANMIGRALESVFNQSFQNIEIIVVDDGSTDNTKQVVEQFSERIIYIYGENKGPAIARNRGMRIAKGKYIAFLDSDDTYLSDKIHLQVIFMEKHTDIGMVYTEWSCQNKNNELIEYFLKTYHTTYYEKGLRYDDLFEHKKQFLYIEKDSIISCYFGNIFRYVILGTIIPTNTVLFRREILDNIGFQREEMFLGEEYDFTTRICKNYNVAFINYPTYVHHLHDGQINPWASSKHFSRYERIMLDIKKNELMLDIVNRNGYEDKEIYHLYKNVVDNRIADLYFNLGLCWLEIGNKKKAGKYFLECCEFNDRSKKNRKYKILLFIPNIITRKILKLRRKILDYKFELNKQKYA